MLSIDASRERVEGRRFDIAIVGAGASATALCVRLAEAGGVRPRVAIIERTGDFGPGLAYARAPESCLLNIPAGEMSIDTARPSDFAAHVAAQYGIDDEAAFLPRSWYGEYLREVMRGLAHGAAFDQFALIGEDVSDLVQVADGWQLHMRWTRPIVATHVVLATGNEPAGDLPMLADDVRRSWRYIADPLREIDRLRSLGSGARVLCVGTGLTMVDVASLILDRDPAATVVACSRRGLLPRAHVQRGSLPLAPPLRLPGAEHAGTPTLRQLVARVRQEIRRADALELDIGPLVTSLRTRALDLWMNLSADERRAFATHVVPYWNAIRHRMPPSVGRAIQTAIARGRLTVEQARFDAIETATRGIVAHGSSRGQPYVWMGDAVINCTGPARSLETTRNPLLKAGLRRRWLRPDPLGLGFTPAPGVSESLHVLGPPLQGQMLEATAVPEIRTQAAILGRRLATALLRAREAGPALATS